MHRRLSERDLLAHPPFARLGARVLLFDEVDGTNAHLLEHAEDLPDGTLACAEFQTAGRGRLGRRWIAPRGAAILLSYLLIEPLDSALAGLSTVLTALAACEAIESTTDCRPTLRWPNDIVLDGRKLGGVLAESRPLREAATPLARPGRGSNHRRALVVGVGINCLQQRGHFPPELADAATSLELASTRAIDRAALAGRLVERLDRRLAEFAGEASSREGLRRAWAARCAQIGSPVTLVHDGREYRGTMLDLAADGGLLVQLDSGARRCFDSATTTTIR